MNKFKLAELFTGTGAFSLAFEKTKKVETVYANDFCKNSEKIFNENFQIKLNCKDINEVKTSDIPDFDILTAGFPCQPFSIAGEQKGFDDERANVFWKILEIIKKKNPRVVIFENVKNLKSHDEGRTFDVITKEIDKLKYYYKYKVLNTCDCSPVPQNRERIYIICFKNKEECDKFNFPNNIEDKEKLEINKMIEKKVNDSFYYTKESGIWDKIKDEIKEPISKNIIYQYRRYYVRENKNNVCPTLTANMGTGGHNVPLIKDEKGIRKLTPRECFNFQGFPSDYKFPTKMSNAALYKLAGNAVSFPVVEKIGKKIIEILDIPEEQNQDIIKLETKQKKDKKEKLIEKTEVVEENKEIVTIEIKKKGKKVKEIIV